MTSWFGKLLEISIQEHFFPIYVYQSFYFLLRIIYIIQNFQVQAFFPSYKSTSSLLLVGIIYYDLSLISLHMIKTLF